MYLVEGNGRLKSQFMFGKPGAPVWDRNFGATVFYSSVELNRVAVLVRKLGAKRFRSLPIEDAVTALTNFISANYYPIFSEIAFNDCIESINDQVSENAFRTILQLIAESDVFNDLSSCFIYPLSTVSVKEARNFKLFNISPLGSFPKYLLPKASASVDLDASRFPQFSEMSIIPQFPSSCLFIVASHVGIAEKAKSAILATISLAVPVRKRYMFSGRNLSNGIAEISSKIAYYGRGPHTPALMSDIDLDSDAVELLQRVDLLFEAEDLSSQKKLNALEYFFKAWFQSSETRFPLLFSTLDALFGDPNQATQAVISGVTEARPKEYDEARLRLLLSLRGSNVHGGSPNVHESSKYSKYIENYGTSPIHELEDIVGMVLKQSLLANPIQA